MTHLWSKLLCTLVLMLCIVYSGGSMLVVADEGVVTFDSDQSDGVAVSNGTVPSSRDIHTVNVIGFTHEIYPASGVAGIYFHNITGNNVILNSGSTEETVSIFTTGLNAAGIVGVAEGVPQGAVVKDPFLNVPLIGDDPAVPGGQVEITSFSDILTNGTGAYGIHAFSASAGYPASVIRDLEKFKEVGFTFEVIEVKNAEGQAVEFAPDQTVEVRGFLVDADGQPITNSEGDIIEHGTFVIGKDGTFSVQFSDEEIAEHDSLNSGESVTIAVDYTAEGNRSGNLQTDNGTLLVVVERNDEGVLEERKAAYFITFGSSVKPSLDLNPTVFPDLEGYVDSLLAKATAGGTGGGVTVESYDVIETQGEQSHGIYAHSVGGKGRGGRGGNVWHSSGAGHPGKSPGAVTVLADGTILTHKDESNGIMALSAGGAGGPGGNGGAVRYGAKGGTGGNGGLVVVGGSAAIETEGEYSSGIVAFSVGGNGGRGGSGSGAMGGGKGGFGGKGGIVLVDGDWDINTSGDKAHGIWAKSLGGNAGNGGSGGWLFGKPGSGGLATDGGSVTLYSRGEIETAGLSSYGVYAQSVGGFGGSGGSSWGLFWSFGGNADSGGSGGDVDLVNMESGKITTNGDYSHAILAQSIGGGGGSGGGKFGLFASLGGGGGSGGDGGSVQVENDGWIETSKTGSYGIFAQSVGGGGGDGGSVSGLVAIGGSGSQTSDGGDVTVTNRGFIITHGEQSHAVFAESIGGGGGNGGRSGGLIAIGGDGGSGGNAGTVTVVNEGILQTDKKESYGIFAQSIGGGGGSGGGAVSFSSGAGVSLGGKGAAGGHGSKVKVISGEGSSITSEGDRSYGIFAQSVGGGGGDGGFAITAGAGALVSVAVGGSGGSGGNAGMVDVTMDGVIATSGEEAYGIFAQSVGGGGGAGGFSIAGNYGGSGISLNLGLGGKGGVGGIADAVTIDVTGTIATSGLRAHGILAQSVGGGGGDGGFSIAGSIGGGTSANISIGGDGGSGNKGGDVNISSLGTITTQQNDAHGIFAQSVGGSGGSGGFSVAASLGGGTSLNLGFGGKGGSGSSAGDVNVGSSMESVEGAITTYGDRSYGILAQSIGGGGGAGGTSIAGALLGPGAISMGFGGKGGTGGLGKTVDVYNDSAIHTFGLQSHGILTQSVGGGGGSGGLSIAGGVTAFGGLSLAMGGDGGSGNSGGDVTVFNSGSIETYKEYSYGIFAQSVGGGGGAGGSSGAVMANFSSLIPVPPEYPTGSVNIAISLGGDGGSGGVAGCVDVENTGFIMTYGDNSYGILAQSVGGGGGDGGKAIAVTANISMPSEADKQIEVKVDFAMALGGDGGAGNHGNEVDVSNLGAIKTSGIGAHGIFAQSVGGGGGSGGDARSMILSIDPSNWSPSDPPPDPTSISVGATISIGGTGGIAGDGGTVIVTNEGTILTRGADAFGILAQSVGGGGGIGGNGYHGLDWQDFGVPEELEPFVDLLPVQDEGDLHIVVGGSGGSAGDGKDVTIQNKGVITTLGDGAIGIFAQSVGGGGGIGGSGAVGGEGSITLGGSGGAAGDGGNINIDLLGDISTSGIAAYGIFAQSVGGGGGYAGNADRGITDFGINFAMAGDGGSAGDGGDVFIHSAGNITTHGHGVIGIFAQSVGGGGGLGGEIGDGFGFAGSVGGDGDGGRVEVVHSGDITTYGDYSHGIFAQSVGGADFGGDVVVRVLGDISVYGQDALAVIAQSEGAAGKKNIDVLYEGGTITGGNASAVGLFEGINNTFTNYGTVTTLNGARGKAILTTIGNDTIHNYGAISGSVDLGAGVNAFYNYGGATFNSGQLLHLGAGATFVNHGIFSPGARGVVCTTDLDAHLKQLASGLLEMDLDMRSVQSDLVKIAGTADLNGKTQINLVNLGYAAPGTVQTTIIIGDGGVTDSGLKLVTQKSAVINYDLLFVNGTDVRLEATIDATPAGLMPNQKKMGEYINQIQASGSAEGFAPFAAELFSLPDTESLGVAYEQLSPVSYDLFTGSTINTSGQYTSSLVKRMHSVRLAIQTQDDTMNVAQVKTNAVWIEGLGHYAKQKSQTGFSGYTSSTAGTVLGFDYLLDQGLLAGLSGGYTDTDVNIKNSSSAGDIDSYFGSLYGSLFTDQLYLDLALSYGRHSYYNYRELQIGSLSGIAKSKHDGDMWSSYIESGFNLTMQDWIFQPFTSLRYTYLDEGSYREWGIVGANLYVNGRRTESLLMNLGIRFSRPVKRDNWVVIPEASLAWDHDFDLDANRLIAAFDSAPAMKFEVDSADIEKDGLLVGVGLTAINTDHVSLSINYNGEFRDLYASHALIGGVRVEF